MALRFWTMKRVSTWESHQNRNRESLNTLTATGIISELQYIITNRTINRNHLHVTN